MAALGYVCLYIEERNFPFPQSRTFLNRCLILINEASCIMPLQQLFTVPDMKTTHHPDTPHFHNPHPQTMPIQSSAHRQRPPTSPTDGLAPPTSPTHGPRSPASSTHGHGPPLGQSSGADTLLGKRTTAQSGGLYTHSYNTGHNCEHSLPPSTERILPINAARFGLHDCMA